MKKLAIMCPECKRKIKIDPNDIQQFCGYCGHQIIFDEHFVEDKHKNSKYTSDYDSKRNNSFAKSYDMLVNKYWYIGRWVNIVIASLITVIAIIYSLVNQIFDNGNILAYIAAASVMFVYCGMSGVLRFVFRFTGKSILYVFGLQIIQLSGVLLIIEMYLTLNARPFHFIAVMLFVLGVFVMFVAKIYRESDRK